MKASDKIFSTVVNALVVAVIGAIGLYFASFASKATVDQNSNRIEKAEKKIEAVDERLKNIQGMICSLAVTLVDDRKRAAEICKEQ